MTMRTDCRHYDSRTYPSGEVVQKCRLDLAPEAPWRCPADCPSFTKRLMDAGWQYGSFTKPKARPSAPVPEGDDVAALLDEAENIVNAAAPEILAEEERRANKGGLFKRRKGKGKGKGKRRK
jgi:hypothetical protein